jgi:hypothetical protein
LHGDMVNIDMVLMARTHAADGRELRKCVV